MIVLKGIACCPFSAFAEMVPEKLQDNRQEGMVENMPLSDTGFLLGGPFKYSTRIEAEKT